MSVKNIRIDKMRYQKNNLSYRLVLLGMALSVYTLFATITPKAVVPTFSTAVEILINIVLLLMTFLAAEKCRAYDKKWGIYLFVISGVHLLRVFYEPLKLYKLGQLTSAQYTWIVDIIIATIALYVVAGVITIQKHNALKAHLKEIGE